MEINIIWDKEEKKSNRESKARLSILGQLNIYLQAALRSAIGWKGCMFWSHCFLTPHILQEMRDITTFIPVLLVEAVSRWMQIWYIRKYLFTHESQNQMIVKPLNDKDLGTVEKQRCKTNSLFIPFLFLTGC